MVKVHSIYSAEGWWVAVDVQSERKAQFGPFTEAERDAFIAGARAFAQPLLINFAS